MRFDCRHELRQDARAALDVLCDAEFWSALGELPSAHPPELLDVVARGGEVRTRLRYRFRGDLPRAVTSVVDPKRLSWVEDTLWDVDALEGHTTIHPDHYPDKLRASARSRLVDLGAGSLRTVDGDLSVRVPIVGRQAERPIVQGLQQNLEALAAAIDLWAP